MTRNLNLTGKGLQTARKAMGFSQTDLATLTGITRCTVSYWETKPGNLWCGYAVDKMMEVLGLNQTEGFSDTDTRVRVGGFSDSQQLALDKALQAEQKRLDAKAQRIAMFARVPCLAKTRKGHPCKNKSEAGRRRCKFHGGMSTGPRTVEGRERIAEAQRKRWQKYRKAMR